MLKTLNSQGCVILCVGAVFALIKISLIIKSSIISPLNCTEKLIFFSKYIIKFFVHFLIASIKLKDCSVLNGVICIVFSFLRIENLSDNKFSKFSKEYLVTSKEQHLFGPFSANVPKINRPFSDKLSTKVFYVNLNIFSFY